MTPLWATLLYDTLGITNSISYIISDETDLWPKTLKSAWSQIHDSRTFNMQRAIDINFAKYCLKYLTCNNDIGWNLEFTWKFPTSACVPLLKVYLMSKELGNHYLFTLSSTIGIHERQLLHLNTLLQSINLKLLQITPHRCNQMKKDVFSGFLWPFK